MRCTPLMTPPASARPCLLVAAGALGLAPRQLLELPAASLRKKESMVDTELMHHFQRLLGGGREENRPQNHSVHLLTSSAHGKTPESSLEPRTSCST